VAWRAWTDSGKLTSWLTKKANVRAEVGGPYELFWEPEHPDRNSTFGCRVLEVVPTTRLSFTWRGPVQYADLMNGGEPPPTRVEVEFEGRTDGKTAVRLRHLGWGSSPPWQQARAWQERAWLGAFAELDRFLREESAVLLAPEEMSWARVEPGVSMAMLWGDLDTGPYGSLMRFDSGAAIPLHTHTADMKVVIVSGVLAYSVTGHPDRRLGPGSYGQVPAGVAHTYRCDATTGCVFLMQQPDKLQTTVLGK
jgi:uncharacterized protein YndB with AHSA1/START domain/quercetin dioxygenase-like cupin family protein